MYKIKGFTLLSKGYSFKMNLINTDPWRSVGKDIHLMLKLKTAFNFKILIFMFANSCELFSHSVKMQC